MGLGLWWTVPSCGLRYEYLCAVVLRISACLGWWFLLLWTISSSPMPYSIWFHVWETWAEHQGGFGCAREWTFSSNTALGGGPSAMTISMCMWVSHKLWVEIYTRTRKDVTTTNRTFVLKFWRDWLKKKHIPSDIIVCQKIFYMPQLNPQHGVRGADSCLVHSSMALDFLIFLSIRTLWKNPPCL